MPHLVWSNRAFSDLKRLERFLDGKSPAAARRANLAIRDALQQLIGFPSIGRPVTEMPTRYRDLFIEFGTGGYVVRYEIRGDTILIAAVRHMREADF